ncbi:MAG: hypothetical protein ACNFW9_00765 [Candidatus Kerfeldbacteria bacterium]|jgi:hypothetical protein
MEKNENLISKNIVVIIVFVFGIFMLGALVYDAFTSKTLSARESTLISIFSSFLIAQGFYIFGKTSSRIEAMEGFKGETQKAYRRSEIIKKSSETIQAMLSSRMGVYKAKKELNNSDRDAILEIFRSGILQMDSLIDHLNASMKDWADIIPEFVDKRKEVNKKIADIRDELNKQRITFLEEVDKVKKATEKSDGEKKNEIDILKTKIGALESEKYSEIKQIDPLDSLVSSPSGMGVVYSNADNVRILNSNEGILPRSFVDDSLISSENMFQSRVPDLTKVEPNVITGIQVKKVKSKEETKK